MPHVNLLASVGCIQIILGLVHNLVFGSRGGYSLRGDSLWFYTGGLALVAIGSVAILAARLGTPFAGAVTLLMQGLLFVFGCLFASDKGKSAAPQTIGLCGSSALGALLGGLMIFR